MDKTTTLSPDTLSPDTLSAGIDIAKAKLDIAVQDQPSSWQVANTAAGFRDLVDVLRRHEVSHVGVEASGGYEQAVVAHLRAAGFVVIVFQPAQVRAYARFVLQHAKNDRIDAVLIARCTIARCTAAQDIHEPPDARLAPLARRLTVIEQLTEDIAVLKTRRHSCHDPQIRTLWTQQISAIKALLNDQIRHLVADIRRHRDLAERLDLITSVDGIGLRTALAILVRMPEIGRVSREQVAALAGLAPYDDDSGSRSGMRHIKGGRKRLRRTLYAAALPAAFQWNRQLKALYARLRAAGKPHKLALVACARKLLIFVNTVVARKTPWISATP